MSHFVSSELPDDPINAAQVARFKAARKAFRRLPASLANSSGMFLDARPVYDLARPGYALYGGNPTPGKPNPMRPVVTLSVAVQQTRWIEAGATCGYNAQWTAGRRDAARDAARRLRRRPAARGRRDRRAAGGRGRDRGKTLPAGRPHFDGPRASPTSTDLPEEAVVSRRRSGVLRRRRGPRRFRRAERHDRLPGADRPRAGATGVSTVKDRRDSVIKMQIREAVAGDSEQACNVMRRSITELCAADHGNDSAILARWLANKTPENVAVWIARARQLPAHGGRGRRDRRRRHGDRRRGDFAQDTSRPTRGFGASAERSSPRSNPGRRSAARWSAVSRARKRRIASTAAPATSRTDRRAKNSAWRRATG